MMKKTNENRLAISSSRSSRRIFLKNTAAVMSGALAGSALPLQSYGYFNSVDETVKISLIGCGKRGTGAAVNSLKTKGNVKLVAMADVFRDKLDDSYNALTKISEIKDLVQVPEENKFIGFNAYKNAIELADVVLLATPGAFRPDHFDAAVNAGKHVFMEKPLATDSPGVRQILAAGEAAKKKNLKVLVGLQNRYGLDFQDLVKRVRGGEIGEIITATDYYLIGPLTHVPRQPQWNEMEFQMRNWRHFNWLWTGSPAGLQIHNTDVVNWVKGSYPVKAQGLGGRASMRGPEYGDIFDSFFIEYEYEDGMKLNSQIRHITGTFNKGGAFITGTKGIADFRSKSITDPKGNIIWRNKEKYESPYQVEMDVLFDAVRNNKPLNDVEWGAKSTMTTIMGRMAAHSGQMIEWDAALNSELTLMPERLAWDAKPQSLPDKNGEYPIPVPGLSPIL